MFKNVFCEPKQRCPDTFKCCALFPKRFLSSILKTTITQPILFQTSEYIFGCCGSLKQQWPLIMSHRLETLRRGGSSLIGMISSSRVASQDTNGWNLPRPFSNVCAVFQQITQIQGPRRTVIKKGSGRFQVDTHLTCMHPCIHTYMHHICLHPYVQIDMQRWTHGNMDAYIRACIRASTHAHA